MSVNRRHGDLEFLILRWSTKNHSFVVDCAEFGPTLEDVAALTMLPLYGDTHTMGVVLSENDNRKFHYLN